MAKKGSKRTEDLDYQGYKKRFKQRLQSIINDIVAENWPSGRVDLFSQYREFPYPSYEWAKRIAEELEAMFKPVSDQYEYTYEFSVRRQGNVGTIKLKYSPINIK